MSGKKQAVFLFFFIFYFYPFATIGTLLECYNA
jgi:hypothetical protein